VGKIDERRKGGKEERRSENKQESRKKMSGSGQVKP